MLEHLQGSSQDSSAASTAATPDTAATRDSSTVAARPLQLSRHKHHYFQVRLNFHTVQVDLADIDTVLVGDSVSMVVHGHDTTLPITLDDMLSHCKAVARGATRAFLIGDLPFGSYETSTTDAVKSAIRMLKEGGMDAVKLEGRH